MSLWTRAPSLRAVAAAACLATLPARGVAGVPQYYFTELALPVGANAAAAHGLNAAGQVVGHTTGAANSALQWSGLPGPTVLGQGVASDINDVGMTAGGAGQPQRATVWNAAGALNLGTLGGATSFAHAINDAGSAVGTSRVGAGTLTQAFLWRDFNDNGLADPGEMRNLGGLASGAGSTAFNINTAGVVVGEADVPGLPGHADAFLWRDANGNFSRDEGEFHALGTLGGSSARATAINDAGVVAGSSTLGGDALRLAYRYTDADGDDTVDPGEMTPLPGLPGHNNHGALDINSAGDIVGFAANTNGTRACLWIDQQLFTIDALIADLPAGFRPQVASGINDAGLIVGWGVNASGATRPFLLTPVPEPSVAAAVSIVALLTRRRSMSA